METIQYPSKTKASKEHRCDFCAQKINKGEDYLNSIHKNDGEIYAWKTHQYCSDLADRLDMYEDGMLTQEGFQETVHAVYDRIFYGKSLDEEVIDQLRQGSFKVKFSYLLRYYRKLDKEMVV